MARKKSDEGIAPSQRSLFETVPVREQVESFDAPTPESRETSRKESHRTREIERLVIGAPVVFHDNNLKIKDADSCCGAEVSIVKEVKRNKAGEIVYTQTGKISHTLKTEVTLREKYSPKIKLAANANLIDYEPLLHKEQFKYVVVQDADAANYITNYQGEYGVADTCRIVSGTDFFQMLCQAEAERYFREQDRPARVLPLGALIHVVDYAKKSISKLYDDAASIGLQPLYDLLYSEDIFKYIVCPETRADEYIGSSCEVISAAEFEALVYYTKWMQPSRFY